MLSQPGVLSMSQNEQLEVVLQISMVKDEWRFYKAGVQVHNKYKHQYRLVLVYVPNEEIYFTFGTDCHLTQDEQKEISKVLLGEIQSIAREMLIRPELIPCDQPLSKR
jgi:hypothetical protein